MVKMQPTKLETQTQTKTEKKKKETTLEGGKNALKLFLSQREWMNRNT